MNRLRRVKLLHGHDQFGATLKPDTSFLARKQGCALWTTLRRQLQMRQPADAARMDTPRRKFRAQRVVVQVALVGCSYADTPAATLDFSGKVVVDRPVLRITARQSDQSYQQCLVGMTGAISMIEDERKSGRISSFETRSLPSHGRKDVSPS